MKIELNQITVRDLVEDYHDDGEGGVRGYGGKLDIRPPFQREFVYKAKQRDAVIETINKGFPLNVMYWALHDDGSYEVIDGQQRTISAAQYVGGDSRDGVVAQAGAPLGGGLAAVLPVLDVDADDRLDRLFEGRGAAGPVSGIAALGRGSRVGKGLWRARASVTTG